jgi:hypothetical protein
VGAVTVLLDYAVLEQLVQVPRDFGERFDALACESEDLVCADELVVAEGVVGIADAGRAGEHPLLVVPAALRAGEVPRDLTAGSRPGQLACRTGRGQDSSKPGEILDGDEERVNPLVS